MNMTDGELLQRYVGDRSESAFAELVTRHINLVHSAALRQVNGDAHLAEDVTQSVFATLARKAPKLLAHGSLTGWLYTSTRFVATNVRRTEQRRTTREQEAHAMNALFAQPENQPDWSHLQPVLDEAMHQLDEPDREAVLLRHFQNHSYAEIGGRIGLTENAARMRVERALEKLHRILAKQGVALTVMALAGLLSANAAMAAPAGLAAKVVTGALAGAVASGTLALGWAGALAGLQSKFALVVTSAAVLGVLALVYETRGTATAQNNPVKAAAAGLTNPLPAPAPAVVASIAAPATNPPATNAPAKQPRKRDGLNLHLTIVTADGSQPVPAVPIDYRGWSGDKFKGKHFVSDRFGECEVDYPTNITELELTTRKDGFADTQLLWRPPNGEVIPTNYVLRLDWPVAIGGTVVDADGKPVAEAKVGWNNPDDPATAKTPQSHNFQWIETTTDDSGKWRINRMAEEVIPTIYGSARHSNYVATGLVFAGRDPAVEKQLRTETYVFHLGRALTVRGIVVDGDGNPVPDASVLVGYVSGSDKHNTKSQSDGTFEVGGGQPGKQLVTAEAKGFAATTMEVELAENAEPIRLVLTTGKVLRLRVTDNYGTPIPGATIWYDCVNGRSPGGKYVPAQVDFNPKTDKNGRAVLTNAPDMEMNLEAYATGFLRNNNIKVRPDGEEHVIKLLTALVVHGTVCDQTTGERIQKFRIAQGWPHWNPGENTTNVQWSSIGRFWLDFAGGAYSHTFEEGVAGDTENPEYVLKFMADGYTAFVSRVITANEGNVELNVTLRPATTTTVTVNKPDGRLAALADIGLVFPGAKLELARGGFSRVNLQSGGSLLRADATGTFVLQPDDALIKVVAASPDGYGEATPAALAVHPVIQMQPWGRLEAMCYSGGKPVAGREYGLAFADVSGEALAFEFDASRVTSDASGKIIVDKLPAGQLNLVRHHPVDHGWSNGTKTPFEIKPGETTTLSLGTSNYTVSAQVVWPAGMPRQPGWQIFASVHTPMPPIPQEIMTNPAAMKELEQTEEFKTFQKSARSFTASFNADGTLSAEEVVPGDYELEIYVFSNPGGKDFKQVALGGKKLTVPSDPPTGALDVGPVEMKAAPPMP
ncbi:MAG: sigma-70 family RNA polymerase sigma factor [Verrucomicrobiae bacterium]|nr:sigma-70 family RNA polymerase sigma factor [Verrucomicrobiae bacterium]